MEICSGEVSLFKDELEKWKNPRTEKLENVHQFTWITKNRLVISIATLGPIFTHLNLPDRDGDSENVLQLESEDTKKLLNYSVTKIDGKENELNFEADYTMGESDLTLKTSHPVGDGIFELIMKISVNSDNSMEIHTTAKSTVRTSIDIMQEFPLKLSYFSENFIQIDENAKKWHKATKLAGNESSKFLRLTDKSSGRTIEVSTQFHQLEFQKVHDKNLFNFHRRVFDAILHPGQEITDKCTMKFKIQVPIKFQSDQSPQFPIHRFTQATNEFPLHTHISQQKTQN